MRVNPYIKYMYAQLFRKILLIHVAAKERAVVYHKAVSIAKKSNGLQPLLKQQTTI